MPVRRRTAKRAAASVDDLEIGDMLDLLAGCQPGDRGVRWATWSEMFAEYKPLRKDFLARFRGQPEDESPWIERVIVRWKRNPQAREFSETVAERWERVSREQREYATAVIADLVAQGKWIGPAPEDDDGAALAGAGPTDGGDDDAER